MKENEPNYVIPPSIFLLPHAENANEAEEKLIAARKIYAECMKNCWNAYAALIGLGLKKEDARFVLPNAACTEICVSGNFREWYNFLELRLDVHAQWEIRTLAWMVLDKLISIAPNVFTELREKHKDCALEDLVLKRAADIVNNTAKMPMTPK